MYLLVITIVYHLCFKHLLFCVYYLLILKEKLNIADPRFKTGFIEGIDMETFNEGYVVVYDSGYVWVIVCG